ncbi:MAG: hypothetical protein M5R41_15245 [Bacteroidia bacterium]|nr:hypothetical protein [Bacteroidia bacterium]
MNDKTTIPKRLRALLPHKRFHCLRTMLALLLLLCATKAYPQVQWTEVKLPKSPNMTSFSSMVWADSLHGYLFGRFHGVILKTSDGGARWLLDFLPPGPDSLIYRSGFEFRHADFKGRDFGVVTFNKYGGRDSLLFYTTDGGATWSYHLIKMNSPFENTMNPPGSQLRVDANRALFLYYTRQYDDGVIANVITRSDDYGATWRELGGDTVSGSGDLINYYVMLDSLTHYRFTTLWDIGDFSRSEARVTTDGRRNWSGFPELHYLWFIDNSEIQEVRMINDTSVSIRLRDPNGNGGPCIVSRDIRNHLTREAWYNYGHPYTWPNGWKQPVYDLLYHDGTYIARITDSVMVFRENPPERAQKLYVPGGYYGSFYLQPGGRVWHLNWGKLWVLDYRTLGSAVTLPAPSHDIEGFECYPQPFSSSLGVLTLRLNSKQRHAEVELAVYDSNGRRLYDREIGDIAPGMSDVHVDMSAASFSQLPSNAVLFIELRTQNQRFYTKSLFLKNK